MILFQAQIEEHQKLAEHYRELAAKREALAAGLLVVQQQADSDLSSLKLLVDKCKEVAPSAIASLKSAILQLFPSDGDNDGNQPNDPTPDTDPDEPELLCLNGETGEALTTADIAADHPHKAELNGQALCVWSSPFASPLVCLLEDAPLLGQHCQLTSHWEHDWELEPLDGQFWEIATPLCCLLSDVPQHNKDKGINEAEGMGYIELVTHPENKALAYQRKHDGEIVCVYVGFRTKAIAQSWMRFIEAVTDRVELRGALRMQGFKWEMKVKGMSIQQIERLAKEDIDKTYRPEIASAKPPTYKPRAIPQPVNPSEVGEGDIVTALLTPSASYKVIQVMPNGILDCTNLTTGDRLGLRPAAVTLVQKAEAEFEFNDLVEVKTDTLDAVKLVGCFGRVKVVKDRIGVDIDGQLLFFSRQELQLKSRAKEEEPQQQTPEKVPAIFSAGPYSKNFCSC